MAKLGRDALLTFLPTAAGRAGGAIISSETMSDETLTHSPAPSAAETRERRRYDHVREIFEGAAALIAPFFAAANRWSNVTLDLLAYHRLREQFPELSFEEAHVLVAAVRRVRHPGR